jgi:hypothetical protein
MARNQLADVARLGETEGFGQPQIMNARFAINGGVDVVDGERARGRAVVHVSHGASSFAKLSKDARWTD